jgi:hypothetical protein
MDSERFNGRLAEMRDSPWLASEDLEDPNGDGYLESAATIEAVLKIRKAQFKGGRTKNGFAVKFTQFERMLFLNGINRDTLKRLCGRKSEDLIGKTVVLYVDPNVKLAGKIVAGIRVKEHDAALTPEQEAFVAEATREIQEADTSEILRVYGELLKNKPKGVQDALRPLYAKRKHELESNE